MNLFERCKVRIDESDVYIHVSEWEHEFKLRKDDSSILMITRHCNGFFSSYSVYFDMIELQLTRREKKKLFKLASRRDDYLRLIGARSNM